MKVCVPLNNINTLGINSDLSTTSKILVYDGQVKDYKIVDVSSMNLGEKVQYMISNNIMHLVATVQIPQHYKYITGKGIAIYDPNMSSNALENAYLVTSKQTNANYKNY